MEINFHAVIRSRASDLIKEHNVTLPSLQPLLSQPLGEEEWFAVPGMYGGFSYCIVEDGDSPLLITKSWSRIIGGSGQTHNITKDDYQLVDEGFV